MTHTLKGFFDKAVMDRVSSWLDELRDKRPVKNQVAKYYEKSAITGKNIFVRIENVLGDDNPEITKLLVSSNAIEGFVRLTGHDRTDQQRPWLSRGELTPLG